jgi:AcrR family transcriptional regulator
LDSKNKKDELVDIAGEFFFTKGFAKTSIQNIIDKAEIAKGTFYHYFKSKDDILDAMAKRYVKGFYKKADHIITSDLNAVDKFNKFFSFSQQFKMGNIKVMRVLTKVIMSENNLALRNRMLKHTMNEVAPIYEKIINQGVEEKLFNVFNPALTSKFLINSFAVNGEMMTEFLLAEKYTQEVLDGLREQVRFFEDNMERLLGAEKGSIKAIDDDVLENMIKGLLES